MYTPEATDLSLSQLIFYLVNLFNYALLALATAWYLCLLFKAFKRGFKKLVLISASGTVLIPTLGFLIASQDRPEPGHWFGTLFGIGMVMLFCILPVWVLGWSVVIAVKTKKPS